MRDVYTHIWKVGSDVDRYWSAAAGAYVTQLPPLAFLSLDAAESALGMPAPLLEGKVTIVTAVASEAELTALLRSYGLPGPLVTIAVDDVLSERARRLALGFDYDFGDARGVHRIGTTDADMKGWDEVSKGAQAAINLGGGASEIAIETDTGPVTLTALEFQQVLVAATAYRQPIWLASFALQKMVPIPADYADDSRWV